MTAGPVELFVVSSVIALGAAIGVTGTSPAGALPSSAVLALIAVAGLAHGSVVRARPALTTSIGVGIAGAGAVLVT